MTREMDKETITKTLLGFWKEVLGQEVSAEDEFFNIGGSSLTMFQLLGKISEVFSLEIEPEEFIEMASVRNMSEKVTSFALCLRSSLWVSQASLCNTVLQNF